MKIKKIITGSILGLFLVSMVLVPNVNAEKPTANKFVDELKDILRSGDKIKLAKKIVPLQRDYPVPDIETEADFIKRYDQIFDENLVDAILNSSTQFDWDELSSRYLRLRSDHGVWMDFEGKIIKIDYIPEKGKEYEKMLIDEIKESLHSSLSDLDSPVLYLETKDFKARVDKLKKSGYRFACWSINNGINKKPDLILEKGVLENYGNGGNHAYVFTNNDLKYKVEFELLGSAESDLGVFLRVENGNKIIFDQKTKIINK